MRSYSAIWPTFWTRGSGKKLRGHTDAQLLAMYLITCERRNMIGLYFIGLPTVAHELGISMERVEQALAKLESKDIDIARYDRDAEVVFLPRAAHYQLGPVLKVADKRVVMVRRELEPHRGHRFCREFLAIYGEAYELVNDAAVPSDDAAEAGRTEGASKPLASPFEAPSKPVTVSVAVTGSVFETHDEPCAPKQSTTKKRRSGRKGATLLPEDWTPPDSIYDWAAKTGNVRLPRKSVNDQLDRFRDHWLQAVKNNYKRDWAAAFRTWLRNARKFEPSLPETRSVQGRPSKPDEHVDVAPMPQMPNLFASLAPRPAPDAPVSRPGASDDQGGDQ